MNLHTCMYLAVTKCVCVLWGVERNGGKGEEREVGGGRRGRREDGGGEIRGGRGEKLVSPVVRCVGPFSVTLSEMSPSST